MQGRIDSNQDITLILTPEEDRIFSQLRKPTEHFGDIHNFARIRVDSKHYTLFRATLKDRNTYVYLGYSSDKGGIFREAMDIERIGKIILPEDENSPILINLCEDGMRHYNAGWKHEVRYDGEHKLFIKREAV